MVRRGAPMTGDFGRPDNCLDELRHIVAIVLLLNDAFDQLVIIAHGEAFVDLQGKCRILIASTA